MAEDGYPMRYRFGPNLSQPSIVCGVTLLLIMVAGCGSSDSRHANADDGPTSQDSHLQVTPTKLDFGPQPVGISVDLEGITLKNTASTAITIDSVASDIGVFEWQRPRVPFTLQPSQVMLGKVRFTPGDEAMYAGTLSLRSSAFSKPQQVSLIGQGWRRSAGAGGGSVWISPSELTLRPASGAAWDSLLAGANGSCGIPDLANQDDAANVCILAKALVFARTGEESYRSGVLPALQSIVNSGTYRGRALALARELAAYVLSAELVSLKTYDATLDQQFRAKLEELLETPTSDGPGNLIECFEERANNWGTHCGGSVAAIAAYLGDTARLARVAQVFKGWLGDRSAYSEFVYGDLAWQCNPAEPVGINPAGCMKDGHSIDGVLADDQRRGGGFAWPPPKVNYVYEALQDVLLQAIVLRRAGYDPFNWQDRAILRAYRWLHEQANYPASGDDTWQPHVVNYFYGTNFPAPAPSRPGKSFGWTDWVYGTLAPE